VLATGSVPLGYRAGASWDIIMATATWIESREDSVPRWRTKATIMST